MLNAINIFLICCLAVLYCQAKSTTTNGVTNTEDTTVQTASLVGEVDLVYCFFDTSSSKLQ